MLNDDIPCGAGARSSFGCSLQTESKNGFPRRFAFAINLARAAGSKLKVFRTPIGFHDAYVAAVSQKAALEAWGSDNNLFAQKSAERVTDPASMAEPLAHPGIVIKRLRGTAADQIAALTPNPVRTRKASEPHEKEGSTRSKRTQHPKPAKVKPRPDRSALADAEQALSDATATQATERKTLRDREGALERERKGMNHAHRQQTDALDDAIAQTEAAYEKAMKRWRE